jgi:excisionase family DNA binding protein
VLGPADAASYIGIGLSTLWRMVREGRIMAPLVLSAQRRGWRRADLDRWLDERATEAYGTLATSDPLQLTTRAAGR